MAPGPNITPVLRYRDPLAAAKWLGEAFGFAVHETVERADGEVTYVLLQQGSNFVLVLPVADAGLDALLVQPQAVGGANTQICYITVADAHAHRERALRAGARIEIEPQDDGLGGQFYTCSDLEGHLWSFGTQTYGVAGGGDAAEHGAASAAWRPDRPSGARVLARRVAVLVALALAAAGGWMVHRTYPDADAASAARVDGVLEQLSQERLRLAAAEHAVKEADAKLAGQRASLDDVRRALQQAQAELALERKRKDEAEAAQAALKAAAANLEQGKLRAEAELAAGREGLTKEKAFAKSAGERAAALQAQIDKLRGEGAAEREQASSAKAALLGAQAQLKALREERAAEREQLSTAKAALAGVQAQLKALREAKAQTSAQAAEPPPAAVAAKEEAEKLPAALPPVAPPATVKAGAAEVVTGSVKAPEPQPAAKAELPKGACAAAVQGKWKTAGAWAQRLCQGAETSPEPVRCYEELMRGKVSWGGGSAWTAPHALSLCSGSRNARQTIDCFSGKVAAEEPWQTAIQGCRKN